MNIFAEVSASQEVLGALPDDVVWSTTDLQVLRRDGQVRLWWGTTPLDVFLNTTEFHARAAERCRKEPFAGQVLPFLSCADLAVFKAFFNRTKDWADLEEMAAAGTLAIDQVIGTLVRYLGPSDERIERLRSL